MQFAARAGILAVVVDVVSVTALGWLSPGHEPLHDYFSDVGATGRPYVGWYRVAATISAALHLVFAYGLWRALRPLRVGWIAILLSLFFILHWLGAVAAPCDPKCEWETARGTTHYVLGQVAFWSFGISMLAITWLSSRGRAWLDSRALTVSGLLAAAAAIVLLIADLTETLRGGAERMALVGMGAWHIVLALKLPPR